MKTEFFRELTDAEIDLVCGGDRVYQDQPGIFYYHGGWNLHYGSPGGTGYGGYTTEAPPPPPPPPEPSDTFRTSGNNDCPDYLEGFNTAVKDLAHASALFRDMMDTVHKAGYSFDITNSSRDGHTNQTDTDRRVISWDPFLALATQDNNKVANGGEIPSLVALAHEVAHAYLAVTGNAPSSNTPVPSYTNALEREVVVNYESKIIDNLNDKYGQYGWSIEKRTNDYGSYYTTEGPESTTYSINRPGCPGK